MGFLDDFRKKIPSPKKGTTKMPETTEESKNKRNLKFLLLGIGGFIFFILVFSMFSPDTTTNKEIEQPERRRVGIQSQFEETELDYEEWIMDAAGKIKDATEKGKDNGKAIKKLQEGQDELTKEFYKLQKNMEENFKIIQSELSRPISPSPSQSTPQNYRPRETQLPQEPSGYGIEKEKGIIILEKGSSKNDADSTAEFTAFDYAAIISPSGSIARAVLLTGVYATEGNAYPVLLEITSPLYETKRKINDIVLYSFVIGEALGDISSSRVYVRLQSIALYLKDGQVKTLPIKGFATDASDGTYGIAGDVMQRDGAFLGLSLLASFVGGVGDAVAAAGRLTTTVPTSGGMYQVSQIDSTKIWEVAAASGISQAASQLSERYMKKAAEIRPVVCIEPGVIIDIILINDLKEVPFQSQQTGGNS